MESGDALSGDTGVGLRSNWHAPCCPDDGSRRHRPPMTARATGGGEDAARLDGPRVSPNRHTCQLFSLRAISRVFWTSRAVRLDTLRRGASSRRYKGAWPAPPRGLEGNSAMPGVQPGTTPSARRLLTLQPGVMRDRWRPSPPGCVRTAALSREAVRTRGGGPAFLASSGSRPYINSMKQGMV